MLQIRQHTYIRIPARPSYFTSRRFNLYGISNFVFIPFVIAIVSTISNALILNYNWDDRKREREREKNCTDFCVGCLIFDCSTISQQFYLSSYIDATISFVYLQWRCWLWRYSDRTNVHYEIGQMHSNVTNLSLAQSLNCFMMCICKSMRISTWSHSIILTLFIFPRIRYDFYDIFISFFLLLIPIRYYHNVYYCIWLLLLSCVSFQNEKFITESMAMSMNRTGRNQSAAKSWEAESGLISN